MDAMIRLTTLEPTHFDQLESLQRICYPTLGAAELMQAQHFAAQYQIFPRGQIVALHNECVVGQGSGFFIDFDLAAPNHSFRDICADFYFTNHDPDGDYYYGADISVHPDYRGRGIGTQIYRARQALVRQSGKHGIIAGGLLPGYPDHREALTIQDYVEQVQQGHLTDPTLTFQLKMGFIVCGLIEDYIEDSASNNCATLLLWKNPDVLW